VSEVVISLKGSKNVGVIQTQRKPMHALEKILSKASNKTEIQVGETIDLEVDMAMMHDREGPQVFELIKNSGTKEIWDINKVVIIFDHDIPSPTIEKAEIRKSLRESMRNHKLKNTFREGIGICHQVMMEKGFVWPGAVIVGTDLGEGIYGALGAFGIGIKHSEMATVLMSGKLQLKVPEIMGCDVNGRLSPMVMAKDVALNLAERFGDGVIDNVIEFLGETIARMSVDGRITLCNMTFPMGAISSFIEVDETTNVYVKEQTGKTYTRITTDSGYKYEKTLRLNVDKLEPLIALPHDVTNVKPVTSLEGTEIHQALLGTCTGGRLEDIRVAAKIIKGHKVSENVRLLVTPASSEIYFKALKQGLMATILGAGGIICPPVCGPCHGGHMGVLASAEVCISTGNRNNKGRMGHPDSYVYLASPATVAASAIEGKIIDPRQLCCA